MRPVPLLILTAALILVFALPMSAAPALQSVSACKQLRDGSEVNCELSPVTAVFGNCIYIEQSDRTSGIRVEGVAHSYTVGQPVYVSGVLGTNTHGERFIQCTSDSGLAGSADVPPVSMPGRSLGGGNWLYDPDTGAGQRGVTGGSGLNNIGLLVKVSGIVKAIDPGATPRWFEIDDGSSDRPVRVVNWNLIPLAPSWQCVTVTGICSCDRIGDDIRPVLAVRGPSDISTDARLDINFVARPERAAPDQTVTFDGRLSTSGMPSRGIVSYEWDFDCPGSSFEVDATGPVVTHAYPAFGAYWVRLRITDSGNPPATATADMQMSVSEGNLPPVISRLDPFYIGEGETITLGATVYDPNAAAGDSIVGYAWDLDDDGQFDDATGANVPLTWAQVMAVSQRPGDRTISLRATDSLGLSTSRSTTLGVYPGTPIAAFSANPNTCAPGTAVTLNAGGSRHIRPDKFIVLYEWDFDYSDFTFNPMATGGTTTFTPPAFGDYRIALRVTDNSVPAKSSIVWQNVSVSEGNRSPIANAGGPYVIDQGSMLALNGAGSSDPDTPVGDAIVSYSWDVNGDGTFGDAVGVSPTLTWAQLNSLGIGLGTRTITLRVTDRMGMTSTGQTTLSVYTNQPTAAFSAKPSQVRPGVAVTLDGSKSSHSRPDRSIVQWEWDFVYNGSTFDVNATGAQVSTTYSTVGTRTVALRVTDNNSPAKTSITTRTVTVQNGNMPPVAMPGGPYVIDAGAGLTLSGSASYDPDASTGDLVTAWQWDVNGDGSFDAVGSSVTLTWAQLQGLGIGIGSRTIKLRVTDAYGATGEDTAALSVCNNAPTASFAMTPPQRSGCGETCYFDGRSSTHGRPDRAIVSYEWDFRYNGSMFNPMASGVIASYVYPSLGTYTVALRVTDNNSPAKTHIATKTITVEPRSAPRANPGGPYAINIGDSLSLDGWSSWDPDIPWGDSIAGYTWDVNGDGTFGDATGSRPTLTWAQLQALLQATGAPVAGVRTVTLRVTDTTGRTATAPTALTVYDNRPFPVMTVSTFTAAPGQNITFSGERSTHGHPNQSIVRYEWDFSYNGSFQVDAQGKTLTHRFDVFGEFTVALRVFDSSSRSNMTTATVRVDQGNLPPVADPGAPYSITVGSPLMLNGTASFDPNESAGDCILSYAWDIDNDGMFDDSSSASPNLTWSQLQAMGIGIGTHEVYLRVTDAFGALGTSHTTLVVR